MLMPYLRIRPCWLPQTRQLRDPAPYFLGWEFHTLSCAIVFLPHLEGFANRWSSCALTTGSTRPYVACVDPSATSCPAMRPPFTSQSRANAHLQARRRLVCVASDENVMDETIVSRHHVARPPSSHESAPKGDDFLWKIVTKRGQGCMYCGGSRGGSQLFGTEDERKI